MDRTASLVLAAVMAVTAAFIMDHRLATAVFAAVLVAAIVDVAKPVEFAGGGR